LPWNSWKGRKRREIDGPTRIRIFSAREGDETENRRRSRLERELEEAEMKAKRRKWLESDSDSGKRSNASTTERRRIFRWRSLSAASLKQDIITRMPREVHTYHTTTLSPPATNACLLNIQQAV
jgi:hypothetical protein